MGSLYRRKGSRYWWLKASVGGRVIQASTQQTDEAAAREVLRQVERQQRALERVGAGAVPTVDEYRRRWLEQRKRRGVKSARDDAGRFGHLPAELLGKRLDQVEREDVRLAIRGLMDAGEMAPRTVRRVHEALRVMFRDAVADGIIRSAWMPLEVRRKELPPLRDASPSWRAGARFSREELELLLSSEAIPLYRRTLYAVLALGAVRISEAADLRWGDYEAERRPLGGLLIDSSWDRKSQSEGSTKTGLARWMPVHPLLARVLAEWRLSGWPACFGYQPGPGSLLFPSRMAERGLRHLNSNTVKRALDGDLQALGMRPRRVHDFRRSFISLAREAGASELLSWGTHGEPQAGRSRDVYTTPGWEHLCQQVLLVQLELRGRAEVVRLHAATAGGKPAKSAASSSAQGGIRTRTLAAENDTQHHETIETVDSPGRRRRSRVVSGGHAVASVADAEEEPPSNYGEAEWHRCFAVLRGGRP